MAKKFKAKNYFKKIHAPDLLVELYKRHSISAIFEITEQTARKNVLAILDDFYTSLSPEQKIEIVEELTVVESVSTAHGVEIIHSLLKEKGVSTETTIECHTPHDKALFYHLFHKELFDEALFVHQFYIKPKYMLYEAKKVDFTLALLKLTELKKEYKRLINKEGDILECEIASKSLDDVLYIHISFYEEQDEENKKIKEEIRIAYLPNDKEVLISYTGSKYEKLLFLDTFLRVVCDDGYKEKVESFDLKTFKDESFDFSKTNKGTPLLTWKVKAIGFSFGNEKIKKRVRLTLPSSKQENGLTPLYTSLEEMGITKAFKNYTVESVSLSFSFTDKNKADKVVSVQTNVSLSKSSLCPLFFYHRYARKLLKQAGIENGFVEAVKKEKDKKIKNWEM